MLSLGEAFDVACFGGVTAYHATRVEGGVAATVLSSVHVRCVDMEMLCQPKNPSDKEEFERNTREASSNIMLYTASVDHAWGALPNHARVSQDSVRTLQAHSSI